jgi:mRNA interferase RelE/StbE
MKYQLRIKPSAEKELKKLSDNHYLKILSVFTSLSFDPFIGKKMRGEYNNHYTYRVWPYRIIYQIYKKELMILVIAIGHRQGVYNK